MQLKKLHLQGFTSYIDSELEFKDNVVSTIVAPNGYGKSSILEAITTALFYKARGVDNKGTGMENLINNTCEEFIITLDFAIDNIDYRIIRKKSKTKHELRLFVNNIEQSEKIADTQNKIYDIIKMNYETFLDTVCVGQGKSGNFMSKPPNERKEVFANILNLGQYEVYEKRAKEEKKSVNNEIQQINAKISVIESKCIDEENIKQQLLEYEKQDLSQDIINAKKAFEEEKEKHIQYNTLKQQQEKLLTQKQNIQNKINTLHNNINSLKQQFVNAKQQHTQLETKLSELQSEVIEIPTITFDIDELNKTKTSIQENINNYKQNITKLQTTINLNKAQINDLKQQYTQLKEYTVGVCKFCGSKITPEHKEQHLKDLFAQAKELSNTNKQHNTNIEEINLQIEYLKADLTQVDKEIISYNKQVQYRQEQELKKEKQTSAINLCMEKINNIKAAMQNIKTQKQETDIRIEELTKELTEYEDIPPIENKAFNDTALEIAYNNLLDKQKDIDTQITICKNKLNEIAIFKQEINNFKQEVKDLELKLSDYTALIEAFGKKGIPADIIANVLPDIENEVNKILDVLFNNSINIEFLTQKENSKGNNLETLEIIIHDNNVDRKYETYSGGEKFRIDFAFHIGLSKFLSKRANANIEFFMIDEGLGSQDDEGKDNFIMIVNQIKTMFKQIFIITHIDEIKDVFDDKITITKDPIKGSIIKTS